MRLNRNEKHRLAIRIVAAVLEEGHKSGHFVEVKGLCGKVLQARFGRLTASCVSPFTMLASGSSKPAANLLDIYEDGGPKVFSAWWNDPVEAGAIEIVALKYGPWMNLIVPGTYWFSPPRSKRRRLAKVIDLCSHLPSAVGAAP